MPSHPPGAASAARSATRCTHSTSQRDRPLDEAGLRGPVGGVRELQLGQSLGLGAGQVDWHVAGKAARRRNRDMGSPTHAEDQVEKHRQGRWFR